MIVAATLPLLLEHGELVTTRQIAEAAGIAEGTIFRVFADKDELHRRRRRGRRSTRRRSKPALARHRPSTSPFEAGRRRGRRDPAAARHRHLAADVERRHPLPRAHAPPDGRQRRARSRCSTPHRDADRGRADRRGPAAARAHAVDHATRCSSSEPHVARARSSQLFLHGVGGGRADADRACCARTSRPYKKLLAADRRAADGADRGRADAARRINAEHHRQRRPRRRHRLHLARGRRDARRSR